METLLKIATAELGVKEIPGGTHNQRILQYANECGFTKVADDETAWCSIFVNWCCMKADLARSDRLNARSWLRIGKKTSDPQPGDIVVFWRSSIQSWKGHVGFFLGFSADSRNVFCLGGNQGNRVSITAYDREKVLDYRRISGLETRTLPAPVLKRGDKGSKVVDLQIILNVLEYNCGDADGDYGMKTENAVKLLQANNELEIDGKYGKNTRNVIESLLQA